MTITQSIGGEGAEVALLSGKPSPILVDKALARLLAREPGS
jgi:hypothetical protein